MNRHRDRLDQDPRAVVGGQPVGRGRRVEGLLRIGFQESLRPLHYAHIGADGPIHCRLGCPRLWGRCAHLLDTGVVKRDPVGTEKDRPWHQGAHLRCRDAGVRRGDGVHGGGAPVLGGAQEV